jgi:hypothetical protein
MPEQGEAGEAHSEMEVDVNGSKDDAQETLGSQESSMELTAPQEPSSPPPENGLVSAEPTHAQQSVSLLNGIEVYVYGSGADFKKKTPGVLVVQENSGDVLVRCMEKDMTLDEFALVGCNRYISPAFFLG